MTLRKSGSPSFFSSRFTSVISIALALYMTGIFFVFGLLSRGLSVYMKENLSFSIILQDDLREADIRRMQEHLDALPFVRSTEYVSRADAAEEMKAELGEDPEVFLGFNPFHASIGVTLKSEYANAESLQEIEKKLTEDVRVVELSYRKDIMQTVNENIRRIGLMLALLITLLLLISFVLISNTIRLLIYSQRFLIYTMRLVGATPEFIRRPFIRSAVVNGAVAGLLADALLAATSLYLKSALIGADRILPAGGLVTVFLLLPLLGVALSVGAAYFAVNRYLYMERGRLYSA